MRKRKKEEEKKKKPLKWIFFLAFFDKKHKEENSTALQKANMEVEICRGKYVGGINSVIYKKKKKNIKMNFFKTRKTKKKTP